VCLVADDEVKFIVCELEESRVLRDGLYGGYDELIGALGFACGHLNPDATTRIPEGELGFGLSCQLLRVYKYQHPALNAKVRCQVGETYGLATASCKHRKDAVDATLGGLLYRVQVRYLVWSQLHYTYIVSHTVDVVKSIVQ
jgi:hypothetical protein